MKFPTTDDFLEAFGLEPIKEDPSLAYCRYVKQSPSGEMDIDVSFSAVSESFQVVLRCNGRDVVTISSEKARFVEIFNDDSGAGVRAVFDLRDVTSEAVVTFEPELGCRWWTLRSA
jgi:hypothetical protein